jgi:hypothetical protein
MGRHATNDRRIDLPVVLFFPEMAVVRRAPCGWTDADAVGGSRAWPSGRVFGAVEAHRAPARGRAREHTAESARSGKALRECRIAALPGRHARSAVAGLGRPPRSLCGPRGVAFRDVRSASDPPATLPNPRSARARPKSRPPSRRHRTRDREGCPKSAIRRPSCRFGSRSARSGSASEGVGGQRTRSRSASSGSPPLG